MPVPHFRRAASVTAFASILLVGAARAQMVNAPGQIPQGSPFNNSSTENVDFADLDLDGDWDAAFADGGDTDQDQNRIWINLGNAQSGTIGFFADETATRCPAVLDQSRDIEFVDFDNDGDVDIYVSNTSAILSQTNRWWHNTGPGAGLGFYVDETSTRWVGLGGPGSSIAPSAVLPGGGFIDWSCDCDFGDLDNDGDIDLVHSTYGGAFGGQVPTRMFRNDGSGHFSEFNPSGFQLAAIQIANGNPGVWCSGTQQANTSTADGSQCDIAMTALDIEIGDVDGDLDLDLLHGSRNELPRMFRNRLVENGGTLTSFVDVTGVTFPAGYAGGGGHYAQELGDFDNDGDLDIYGLNWQSGLSDGTFKNNGDGTYCCTFVIPGSGSDDNEGDFFDYDSDGDLDLFIANFSGADHVFRNSDGAGTWTTVGGLSLGGGSLDADTADVDDDGDYDAMSARDGHAPNTLALNTTTVDDTFAPRLHRLEQAPNRSIGVAPTVVRVQVYDNASYYTTWYVQTQLEVQVNGGPVLTFPMHSSQGQIFRGEIPGDLSGSISYRAVSTDEHGNTGSTPFLTYTAGSPVGVAYCFGDGSLATPCPCTPPNTVPNPSGAPGHGCANSFNLQGAQLFVSGTLAPDTLSFTCSVASVYSGFAFLVKGDASVATGIAAGDGLRCADGALIRFGGHNAGTNGAPSGLWTYPNTAQTIAVSAATGQPSAQSAHYQLFYRNAVANFCNAATTNFSNAIRVDWP